MDIGRLRAAADRLSFRFLRPGSIPVPGGNRSHVKGYGLSFVGYREYQYGDDIRLVDWNVTARHSRPMLKTFEQEHASALVLVLDASASMRGPWPDKWLIACDLAAIFAFVAARHAEAVGALAVTSIVEGERRPKRGMAHAGAVARWLAAIRPSREETMLTIGVERATRLLRAPGIIVVLSDFLGQRWSASIRQAARRHTVLAIAISSPREREIESAGLVSVRDAETGATRWLDSSSPAVRAAFATRARRIGQSIRRQLRESGAIAIDLRTDEPVIRQASGILRSRGG